MTMTATVHKTPFGYKPKIQLHTPAGNISHTAGVTFTTEIDARKYAEREITEAKKSGWIGWDTKK